MSATTVRAAGDADASPRVDDATYSEYQRDRALAYQEALARAAGVAADVDEAGRLALEDLVANVRGKLPVIITEKITERFGGRSVEGLFEECEAAMLAVIVESAGQFDPDRCASFHGWVTAENGPARKALYACLDVAAGLEGFDRKQLFALRVARGATKTLQERLGRRPTLDELKVEMRDYSFRYQYERLTPQQQSLPEEQWRPIARTKLVKSSMLANIERIGELLAAAEPVVHADAAETGWDHFEQALAGPDQIARTQDAAMSAALVPIVLAGLGPAERDVVAEVLGGTVTASGPTVPEVAEAHDVSPRQVRGLVAAAKARIQAAHAHYAFLAPGVAAQFEQAPASARTSLEARAAAGPVSLLQRLAPPVPA